MGATLCTLSGAGRHSVSTTVTCLNLLLSTAGQVLVLIAFFLKFVLEKRVAIVIGNHGGALAYFLIAVGCILCIVCMASSKVVYDAGGEETATRRTCKMLVFTQACQALALILLLAAMIMCLVHKSLIRDALHEGIIAAIRLYRVDPKIKKGMDTIQTSFHCCGSRSMADWFTIPWIPMKFLNMEHPDIERYIVDGEFIKDDAPFSCCNIHVTRPCIHHDVQNVGAHRQASTTGTLYSDGCNDKLEEYWQASVLNPVLGALVLVQLLLGLTMVLGRLLQTSLDDALDAGDPNGKGDAFLLRSWPCALLPTTDPSKLLTKKKKQQQEQAGDRPAQGGDSDDDSEDSLQAGQQGAGSGWAGGESAPGDHGGGGGGGGDGGDSKGEKKSKKDREKKDKKDTKDGKDKGGKNKDSKGKDKKSKEKKAGDKKKGNKKGTDKKKKKKKAGTKKKPKKVKTKKPKKPKKKSKGKKKK